MIPRAQKPGMRARRVGNLEAGELLAHSIAAQLQLVAQA
jgi:hypothetical protein